MEKIITATCKGADVLPLDSLEEFQGGLKKLSKQNLERLKKRIIKDGINVPIFVWRVADWCRVLDGHQRLKALQSLRKDGYELPLIPVAYIEAENEKDARQKLLGITSQFGEFEIEELSEWIAELDADMSENLRLIKGQETEIVNISESDIEKFNEEKKEHELKEYKKVHILLTMNQDVFFEIKNKLFELKKIEGIEYEQSQN